LSINTKPLTPGAGSIVLDWLATQSAIHRYGFGVLFIENPRILKILSRGLMSAETPLQACIHCSSGYDSQVLGPLNQFPNFPFYPFSDFYIVQGRPNPERVPLELTEIIEE
jgi:hypothetical protein